MKRARAESDRDSDAKEPGALPEAEGAGRQEKEEAEYFRQTMGEETDRDIFLKAQRRGPTGPPSKKGPVKERKLDGGSDGRPPQHQGQVLGAQAKIRPGGAAQDSGRGLAGPPKRVA